MRKRNDRPMFAEIVVDYKSYLLFEKFAGVQRLERDEALRRVLARGMRFFRSHQLADMVEEYESLKRPLEEYKRDHEVLAKLLSQNLELAELLNAN